MVLRVKGTSKYGMTLHGVWWEGVCICVPVCVSVCDILAPSGLMCLTDMTPIIVNLAQMPSATISCSVLGLP